MGGEQPDDQPDEQQGGREKREVPARWAIALQLTALLAAFVAVVGVGRTGALGVRAAHAAARVPWLFQTHDACVACHNQLTTSSGEDVSIGTAWRATMMANSARDPYWQASVRRETLERPEIAAEIEDECAVCHMPMSRYQAKAEGRHGEVFAHLPAGASGEAIDDLAADGVSCTTCHQILATGLGAPQSFTGGFLVDESQPVKRRVVFGPYEVDAGRTRIMQSASEFRPMQGAHIRSSELCATCHTLYTNARDSTGKVLGRLPEQVPYLEWKASRYGAGAEGQSCQSCHMPAVAESIAISGVWGQQRPGLARHEFLGGNFFMLRMLNRYRADLGTVALPHELEEAAARTVRHLRSDAASVRVVASRASAGALVAEVSVSNRTGHKLPTAYPSRRAWLHVRVRDGRGTVVFESGALRADGSIVGHDGDADALGLEPHHERITSAEQVQVYESVMADAAGRVTTTLLSGVRFIKDNRLLPEGFDKGRAADDVAVRGAASGDGDFTAGGDRVRYEIALGEATGPFVVEAALAFQPIAFRWADNLARHRGQQRAPEIDRFVTYYRAMSTGSAVTLASDSAIVR